MKKYLVLLIMMMSFGAMAQVEVIQDIVDSTSIPDISATIHADNSVTVLMEYTNTDRQDVQKVITFDTVQEAIAYRDVIVENLEIQIAQFTDNYWLLLNAANDKKAIGLSKVAQKQAWLNITVVQ